MDIINLNKILQREFEELKLRKGLQDFEKNKKDITTGRGFYVYGDPGVGKTYFVKKIVEDLGYDVIYYNSSNLRNKSIIESITKHNMSDTNILSLFKKERKKIVIVMDEIDGLSNGDKTALSTLIKLIRPKKTKKQKTEEITYVPIICIGNYQNDKKIKELRKVSKCIELRKITNDKMKIICDCLMEDLGKQEIEQIIENCDGDLRKLYNSYTIYIKNKNLLDKKYNKVNEIKILNEDTKKITYKLLMNKYSLSEHNTLINETDRTSVSLLFHENVIDVLDMKTNKDNIELYYNILENYCYGDYIDRVTFQKQIWIFNEISSLMKTINSNHLIQGKTNIKKINEDVRFTKILTKFSTEYNNQLFIQNLTNILNMDKKDMLSYFIYLSNNLEESEILELFEGYEINKLDIQRIIRFINAYTSSDETNKI